MIKAAQYSSHIPVLLKALSMTGGDVLELGTGYFSTPLIHWLCVPKGRRVVSIDSNYQFVEIAKQFAGPLHRIDLVQHWDDANIGGQWDVVLVDHDPAKRRVIDLPKLANIARLIVVHDTSPEQEHIFHFSEVWPLFKHVRHYWDLFPGTSIVSNFVKLEGLNV